MATSVGSASIVLSVNAEGVSQGLNQAAGKVTDWKKNLATKGELLPTIRPKIIPDTSEVEKISKKAGEKAAQSFAQGLGKFLAGGLALQGGAQVGTVIAQLVRGEKDLAAESARSIPLLGGVAGAVSDLVAEVLGWNAEVRRNNELVKEMEANNERARKSLERHKEEVRRVREEEKALIAARREHQNAVFETRLAGLRSIPTPAASEQARMLELQIGLGRELAAIEEKRADNQDKLKAGTRSQDNFAKLDALYADEKLKIMEQYRAQAVGVIGTIAKEERDRQAEITQSYANAEADRLRLIGNNIEAERVLRDASFEERKRQALEQGLFEIQPAIEQERKAANDLATHRRLSSEYEANKEADSKIRQMYLQSIGQREEAEKEAIKERYRKEIEAATDPKLRDRLNILQTLELNAVGRESSKVGFRASEVQVQSLDVAFTKSSNAVKTAPNKIEGLTERQNQLLTEIRDSIKNGVTARAA